MNKQLRALLERKQKSLAAARAITEKAAAESRDLTDEESTAFAAETAELGKINAAIAREQALIAEEAAMAASAAQAGLGGPGANRTPHITVHPNVEQDPRHGFASFGEFAQQVRAAGGRNAQPDERLLIGAAAPTTFGNESTGADGGFLVPPEFSTEIFRHSLEEDALVPLTDNVDVMGNSMVFPRDETTPWGTDGVRVYWAAEAAAATATKPKMGTSTLRLNKLMGLVPLTDELMADARALGSYLAPKLSDSMRWKTNEAILFGAGNGVPLGAFSSDAVVTVSKEAGQATLTLVPMNIFKMIARLPPGSFPRSQWIMNNDVLPFLLGLTLGNVPIYIPANQGVQGAPYGTLMGRPIMISQHAKSFTNLGDIMLFDPKSYRTITKAEGMVTATSVHLYFDADATAMRVTFRVDGAPKLLNPINPANGSNQLSPFVQLEAR